MELFSHLHMVKEQAFHFPVCFLEAGCPWKQTDPSPVHSTESCIQKLNPKW